ncbi:unnamed protein product [Ilex paraguariensis]|uniref:FATC domain-containing protein n=1 Tax=Ilex paraguariensis TaxID=185542 RepID=A0ABC8ULS4_9AQUA
MFGPVGKNAYALSVLRRVEMKLDGRDIADNREMSIADQVDYLLKQATNVDNLCSIFMTSPVNKQLLYEVIGYGTILRIEVGLFHSCYMKKRLLCWSKPPEMVYYLLCVMVDKLMKSLVRFLFLTDAGLQVKLLTPA